MQTFRSQRQTVIRLVRGSVIHDVHAIHEVLSLPQAGKVVALTPTVSPDLQTLAALSRSWVRLVDRNDLESPSLQSMVRRIVATDLGRTIMDSLATVAPTGWRGLEGIDLVTGARTGAWSAASAAALLGPVDAVVALLQPQEAAFAVQRWGQTFGESSWVEQTSPHVYNEVIRLLSCNPQAYAASLPWLPEKNRTVDSVPDEALDTALLAYAYADARIRQKHADTIARLVQRTHAKHLSALAFLAKTTQDDAIWRRIDELIRSPDADGGALFRLLPWRDMPQSVEDAVLRIDEDRARSSPADIRTLDVLVNVPRSMIFDPDSWDQTDSAQRHEQLRKLPPSLFPLAVRFLGPRADVLAYAPSVSNDLIDAASPHVHHRMDVLRWTLMPIAIRDLTPDDAYAVIAALPQMPPDPVAFLRTASKVPWSETTMPGDADAIRSAAHLAAAVTMNNVPFSISLGIHSCCETLRVALEGLEPSDVSRMIGMLDPFARNRLYPDITALAMRMASPARHETLIHALHKVLALPADRALPSLLVCSEGAYRTSNGSETLASILRDHGETFLALYDALDDKDRSHLLPIPSDDPSAVTSMRALARIDPLVAYHLARERTMTEMFFTRCAILTSSPGSAADLVAALPDPLRTSMLEDALQRLIDVAAAGHEMNLLKAVDAVMRSDPVVALAVAALASEDPEECDAGRSALMQRPDVLSRVLPFMDDAMRRRFPDAMKPSAPPDAGKVKRFR